MPEPDPAKFTPLLNLYKPDRGESGWGPALNVNADILDEILQGLKYTFENINIIKLGGNPIATNKGIATPGTMRVAICNDDTNLTQIEVNTRATASASTNIATRLSAPLGVHIYDNLDQTLGIHVRPLIVYNPFDQYNNPIPITVKLCNELGLDLDLGKGITTPTTLRTVTASDSPEVLALEDIDRIYGLSLNEATLSNNTKINIQNAVLREVNGQLTGIREHPLFVSLMQDGNPLRFSFSAGEYDATTLRVVNATNDFNLQAINTFTAALASATADTGTAPPSKLVMVGKTNDDSKIYPVQGHTDGGVLTHVAGGIVGASLKDDAGSRMGVLSYPLFFRNADHPEDRGQSRGKPFYTTITDPVNIGNGVNIIQLGGFSISRKRGNIEEGTQRVCIADDDTNTSRIVIQLNVIIEKLKWIIEHPDVKYTVMAFVTAGEGVIIPPHMTVTTGRDANFSIIPSNGWTLKEVYLDGTLVGNTNTTQSVRNITADHILTVAFEELPETQFTITSTVLAGQGTIAPVGAISVGEGGTATYNFSPASGWMIDEILVDENVIGSTTSPYIFTNVSADHTIGVKFKVAPAETHKITSYIIGGSG